MIKSLTTLKKGKNSARWHLIVVTTFIIAASVLVVLTTFAISMLTATGDLNRLMVSWSNANSNTTEAALTYFKSGNIDDLRHYERQTLNRQDVEPVINGLLSDSPEPDLIIREFGPDEIHPNEIAGLIRIFTLFQHSPEIVEIKQTWTSTQELALQKQDYINSLIKSDLQPSENELNNLQSFDRKINEEIRDMIWNISGLLLLLKRYSLWFTVLLGILIVLIGVIYTVRGIKNIRKMEELLSERNYLAMFPELNQFPVLNISTEGNVAFLNQAAKDLFPDLKEMGLNHLFFSAVSKHFSEITSMPENSKLFEVEVGGKYYQQAVHFLSDIEGVHIHSIDITELKQKQLEVSHTLKEKEALLAEVHHRVKNNMGVVVGLLELQEMMGEGPVTSLSESISRIKSMAIIHELLYQSESFSEIATGEYLAKLSNHLESSHARIQSIHTPDVGIEKHLNINQAVPLGLLLNEIAFYLCHEATKMGHFLNLELQIININDYLCLEISSLEPAIKNPLSNDEKSTLRMSLIENLLSQIGGELSMAESDTLYIEIKFLSNITKGSSSSLN